MYNPLLDKIMSYTFSQLVQFHYQPVIKIYTSAPPRLVAIEILGFGCMESAIILKTKSGLVKYLTPQNASHQVKLARLWMVDNSK